jgi:transcriptional regulator with XRE-family HTH domain
MTINLTSLKKQFGRRLQQVRSATDLTQEELAEKVGLTIESISNIERGIHGPSFDTLEKIILALNVPAKSLFEFDGQ